MKKSRNVSDEPLISGYRYDDHELNHSHAYLLPCVETSLKQFFNAEDFQRTVFDLGCGNGSVAAWLSRRGYDITGVDPSVEGVILAKQAYPHLKLETGSAYEDLAARFGTFPAVVSIEVIEHVYDPRCFARTAFDLVAPGGIALFTTPFHGYFKNIAVAITGNFDRHVNPLWDHGHIKFWSESTLSQLLSEVGFEDIRFERAGRVTVLAKSMVAIAKRPRSYS
jgi:2-polyprenyl-3-methyl-5-hydroxy-6-metoxy-1,4-benzoquinol methylase